MKLYVRSVVVLTSDIDTYTGITVYNALNDWGCKDRSDMGAYAEVARRRVHPATVLRRPLLAIAQADARSPMPGVCMWRSLFSRGCAYWGCAYEELSFMETFYGNFFRKLFSFRKCFHKYPQYAPEMHESLEVVEWMLRCTFMKLHWMKNIEFYNWSTWQIHHHTVDVKQLGWM